MSTTTQARRRNAVGARLTAFLVSLAALGSSAASHATYVYTDIVVAGADQTSVFDINNSGTMVGYSVAGGVATGFILDGGSFTTLGGPAGAVSSFATGISDAGRVVGSFSTTLGGAHQGFLLTGGSYTVFNIAGATDTFLRGISPDGRYVSGYYTTATLAGVGFVFDSTTGITQIVSIPGSLLTIAQGVNNAGVVVGSDIIDVGGSTVRPGFLYDTGTSVRTDVSIAGAARTSLRAIDESGVLAGWFVDSGGAVHGFLGAISSYEQIDYAGALSTFVEGSNDARWVVGSWTVDGFLRGFLAKPVPEPGTLALLGLGLAGLGVSRRRLAA